MTSPPLAQRTHAGMLYPLLGREEGVHTHTYALISYLSSLLFSDLRAELNTKMENTVAVGAEPTQRSVTLRPACKIIICGIHDIYEVKQIIIIYSFLSFAC